MSELRRIAEETVTRTAWIQKPHLPLRIAAVTLSLGIVALAVTMVFNIREYRLSEYTNFVQALEATISSVVFIGAAILFLVSWENRIKRKRALAAIHELRAMAHIVDMHQLTKDPESYFSPIDSGTTTHGSGCALDNGKVHCFLDWMSGDVSKVTVTIQSPR